MSYNHKAETLEEAVGISIDKIRDKMIDIMTRFQTDDNLDVDSKLVEVLEEEFTTRELSFLALNHVESMLQKVITNLDTITEKSNPELESLMSMTKLGEA